MKDYSTFLNDDPRPWILQSNNAAVHSYYYSTIEGSIPGDVYSELEKQYWKKIQFVLHELEKPATQDILYKGITWHTAEMITMGLTVKTSEINEITSRLMTFFQLEDGSFSFHWQNKASDALRTGDYIYILLKAGIRNRDIDRGIDWILSHQRADKGWLYSPVYSMGDALGQLLFNRYGSGEKYENDTTKASSLFSTIASLKALSHYYSQSSSLALDNGITFLCSNISYILRGKMNIPVRKRWNKNILSIGFPIIMQTDIVDILSLCCSHFQTVPEVSLYFNRLLKKQSPLGRWKNENSSPGMMRETSEDIHRLTTIRVLSLLKKIALS